jgi:hypothetical protein
MKRDSVSYIPPNVHRSRNDQHPNPTFVSTLSTVSLLYLARERAVAMTR